MSGCVFPLRTQVASPSRPFQAATEPQLRSRDPQHEVVDDRGSGCRIHSERHRCCGHFKAFEILGRHGEPVRAEPEAEELELAVGVRSGAEGGACLVVLDDERNARCRPAPAPSTTLRDTSPAITGTQLAADGVGGSARSRISDAMRAPTSSSSSTTMCAPATSSCQRCTW